MPAAVETIPWGLNPNVEQMLRDISEVGYEGVEFFQHPEVLGDPDKLWELLRNFRLRLVGVAGGSFEEKLHFISAMIAAENMRRLPRKSSLDFQVCSLAEDERPYIYIDGWDERDVPLSVAVTKARIALHPHMFKPIQTVAEAEVLLGQYPALLFLPDSAHLTIAGADVSAIITRHFDRLAAVHLKDWSAEFGRAYQFYSRGFTGLGQGDVDLKLVLATLRRLGFRRWFVVEQDWTANPRESAGANRRWLRAVHGI